MICDCLALLNTQLIVSPAPKTRLLPGVYAMAGAPFNEQVEVVRSQPAVAFSEIVYVPGTTDWSFGAAASVSENPVYPVPLVAKVKLAGSPLGLVTLSTI